MAEQETVHPGSFVGDSVEEFKKLPMWGKVAALGAVVLVAYLGYRNYQSKQGAQAAVSSASPAASTSPFPSVNGLPILPSTTNPVYDPNGNLVGYQNAPTPSPVPTTPAPTPAPVPPVSPPSNPPPGTSPGPLIPFGQLPASGAYSNAAEVKQNFTYNGVTYKKIPGPGGKLYGQNVNGGPQVLLYGPQHLYPGGRGGGPMSIVGFMHNPLIYWASASPHKPASTP
jgi:hypothetical protein